MKNASIKQFIQLRQQLETERATITARLREVDAALGASEPPTPKAVAKLAPAKSRKRAKNELSLKEAILKVVAGRALTKEQILEQVQKLGYKFSTKNPLNSMSVVLYGAKPKFKRQNGKFSAA